jgi:ABC-type phosphate/phosphonate transport system substrate-binding protein
MESLPDARTIAAATSGYLVVFLGVLVAAGVYSKSTPEVRASYPGLSTTTTASTSQADSAGDSGYLYYRRAVEYKSCRDRPDVRPAGLRLSRRTVPVDSCPAATQGATDSTAVVYEGGGQRFYRTVSKQLVREEHVLRLVLQNELTEPRRLDSLKRGLQQRVWPSVEKAGFDSIQIGLESDRRKISRQLEQGNIHLAVVPSSVVGKITGHYPSISDWEYQLLLSHDPYRSAVIFRRSTPIRELEDLKRYTVAAPHERSSSGYKIPMGYLRDRGIQPRLRFLDGSHSDVWNAVLRGHVKAGFTYDAFEDELSPKEAGSLEKIEIPIRIPGSVWILREDLAELKGVKSGVRRALRDFVRNNRDPYWREVSRPDAQALTEYDTYRRIMNEME